VYRIDRPPSKTVSLVERALQVAGVDEVYVEGNVVMGTIPPAADARPVWIVEVDLGVPSETGGTLVSVAVRFNDDLLPEARVPSARAVVPWLAGVPGDR